MANDDGLEWLADLQIVGNGRWWSSLNGKGIPEQTAEGQTGFVKLQIDPSRPAFPAPVRIGATINLGNFESARIRVSVEAIGDIYGAEQIWDWAEKWASEILNREVASVKGKERADKELPDAPDCVQALVLGLEYGLTLNLGNYNSRKIDYGYYIPADPENAESTWNEMSAFIGERIGARAQKLRGGQSPKTSGTKKKLPPGGIGI